MRFSVFTHVNHVRSGREFFAYAPYVREMNLWLEKVNDVEIVAPISISPKRESIEGEPYHNSYISFTPIPSLQFTGPISSAISALKLPYLSFKMFKSMRRADHIHLRCPGNIGLIACIVQICFPNKPKTAKYAGNWDPDARQPWSYRLQKKILSNTFLTKNMTVLVYGDWGKQSKNIKSFFTASFKEKDKEEVMKDYKPPFRFLFVGNLVAGKQPQFAIKVVEALNRNNIEAELHVYGSGVLRSALEVAAKNKSYIYFHGNRPLRLLQKAYKKGHFLILASRSEGWPKAIAEAMFFGCIPVVTAVSCVPWMLNYGERGILIPSLDKRKEKRDTKFVVGVNKEKKKAGVENQDVVEMTVEILIDLINNPEEMRKMSGEAQGWSQQYTLERFEEAIEDFLKFD